MTDSTRAPAGAALPKDTRAVRPSIRGQVKGVCITFPACDGSGYFTAAQWRAGKIPRCYCGAGALIPANPIACLELCPDRVAEHPDAAEMSRLAHRGAAANVAGVCESCGHHRAPHLDPDYWYCRRCQHVNERYPDGTMGCFRAAPFSPEVEEANGRARRRRAASAVTIPRRGPDRIRPGLEPAPAPGGEDPMPF